MSERREWLRRAREPERARRLRIVAWILSALVIVLVGVMNRIHFELPPGASLAFLPPVYSAMNALCAVALIVALVSIKRGRVRLHRNAIFTAMSLSGLFLICYVAYHLTTEATKFGGTGSIRLFYFALLISHIVLAAVSLPFILFAFISGFTNHFARHRRLVRFVYPMWLYVAISGPACYLMLRPYY